MSLMNEALRKKKREKKHPPATDILQADSKSKPKNAVKLYGLLAIVILACTVAGFYAWEYFSVMSSESSLNTQPHVNEKIVLSKPVAEPVVQETEVSSIISTETVSEDKLEEMPITAVIARAETESEKEVQKQPDAPVIAKTEPVEQEKPQPIVKEQEPILTTPKTTLTKIDQSRTVVETTVADPEPIPVVQESLNISQLDPVETLFYQKAVSYHRENDLETAIQMYQEVLQKNPHHDQTRFNLSSAYLELGAYAEAYPFLQGLQQQQPDDADIALNLAIAEIGLGRPDQAIALLDRAERLFSVPTFEVPFHKGVAYSRKGEYETALEWYQTAERLQARNPRLILNSAIAFDHLGQYADALNYYRMLSGQQETSLSQAELRLIEMRISVLRTFMAQQASQTNEKTSAD